MILYFLARSDDNTVKANVDVVTQNINFFYLQLPIFLSLHATMEIFNP